MPKGVAKMVTQISPDFYDLEDSDHVCYLCEQPSYTPGYEVTHYGFPFRFQRCQCGLVKQTPMPNVRFFEWFYNSELFFSSNKSEKSEIWGYYDFFPDEPSRLATSRWRYKKLQHLFEVGRPQEIMKIGPSTGTFLYVANQNGHHGIGCDVSSSFVEYAKDSYKVQIDHGRFEHKNYADAQFDAVILFNVIENVPNQVEFLQAINRKLKQGGLFILNFVDMKNNLIAAIQKERYFIYRPPVCYIYEMPVMKRVLQEFGFEVLESHRDIRYMHIEKIATLLGWGWLLAIPRFLRIHRVPFPIYAYPSRIIVARRTHGDRSVI